MAGDVETDATSVIRDNRSIAEGARHPTLKVVQSFDIEVPQCNTRGGKYKQSPGCTVTVVVVIGIAVVVVVVVSLCSNCVTLTIRN